MRTGCFSERLSSRRLLKDRPPRVRLDQLLVDRGLAETRSKAQALILAGDVLVDGAQNPKAGMQTPVDAAISIAPRQEWVGRGGEKLAGAIKAFELEGKISGSWLDCGASTGGFVDVLLSAGAAKVYAVDVGYGQLALSLREDPRVVVIERFNIRNLTAREVPEPLDGATLDLSFISCRLVLPVIARFLRKGANVLLLFKPQFEGERKDIGKGGIVRDDEVRARILERFEQWAPAEGWIVVNRALSPITGQKGNIEYLYQMRRAE